MNSYNLTNGNFITLNNQYPDVSSITISSGKIIDINNINPQYDNIDLKGATVIPGFIDAHFHLKNYGKRLKQLNLKGITNFDDIIDMVKQALLDIKSDEWLIGFGWDQNLWAHRQFPNEEHLNNLNSNSPIYLTRIDGHASWVNNNALKKINQTLEEINLIDGGSVINNCVMIDNAMNPFKSILPSEDFIQAKEWIQLASKRAAAMGITGVHDAWQDRTTIKAIKELIKEDNFLIRCYGMLASSDIKLLSDFFQSGHYNDDYLSIRSVKAFIDGALGSRGAALHEPYCDDLNNCGLILITQEEFDKLANQCYQHNYQLNTHAIGDRGNDYVLNTYEKVLPSKNTNRWRVEHAQMVLDKDLLRFKKHSILPSMQPSHCTSDMKWLDKRIGNSRLPLVSRWQSFINLGVKIPGGSDCPIETGNPIFEFYAAVTRQDHQGFPKGGWQSQEKINRINALKMFTTWAAYGGFDENRRGKIKIGFDADFTILSDDILNTSPQNILSTEILYTIVNGKTVYKK